MPGVDKDCTTHHICDCLREKMDTLKRRIDELEGALEEIAEWGVYTRESAKHMEEIAQSALRVNQNTKAK